MENHSRTAGSEVASASRVCDVRCSCYVPESLEYCSFVVTVCAHFGYIVQFVCCWNGNQYCKPDGSQVRMLEISLLKKFSYYSGDSSAGYSFIKWRSVHVESAASVREFC